MKEIFSIIITIQIYNKTINDVIFHNDLFPKLFD